MPTLIIDAVGDHSLDKHEFARAVLSCLRGEVIDEESISLDAAQALERKNANFRAKTGRDRPDYVHRKEDLGRKLNVYPAPIGVRLLDVDDADVVILVGNNKCSIYGKKLTPALKKIREICRAMWEDTKIGMVTEDNWC